MKTLNQQIDAQQKVYQASVDELDELVIKYNAAVKKHGAERTKLENLYSELALAKAQARQLLGSEA